MAAPTMFNDPITFALAQLKAEQQGIVPPLAPPPAAQPVATKRKPPSTLPPKAQPTASEIAPEVQAYLAEKYPGEWPVKLATEPDYTIDPTLTEASQKLDSELAAKPEETPATLQTTASQSSFRLDPKVKDYLEKRYADRLETLNNAELFANLGDAWAAKPINSTLPWFKEQRAIDKDLTLGEIDRAEDRALKEMSLADSQLFKQMQLAQMAAQARTADELKRLQILTGIDENAAKLGLTREELDQKRQNSEREAKLKEQELMLKEKEIAGKLKALGQKAAGKAKTEAPALSVEERLKKLNSGDKARFDNVQMVMKGVQDMATALEAGQSIVSVGRDNDYTSAERRAAEAFGRMQSGGAIQEDEEARFLKMGPRVLDSEEQKQRKLMKQWQEGASRLRTLGFTPEELGLAAPTFKAKGGGQAPARPGTPERRTFKGKTYELKPGTDRKNQANWIEVK